MSSSPAGARLWSPRFESKAQGFTVAFQLDAFLREASKAMRRQRVSRLYESYPRQFAPKQQELGPERPTAAPHWHNYVIPNQVVGQTVQV